MCEQWYSSEFEPGLYSCLDLAQFSGFKIELRLDLGCSVLRFASRMNLESVPRFAEICCHEVMNHNIVSSQHLFLMIQSDNACLNRIFIFRCTSPTDQQYDQVWYFKLMLWLLNLEKNRICQSGVNFVTLATFLAVFLLSAFLQNCFLCWDYRNGGVTPTL